MLFAANRELPVLDLLPYLRRCEESPYDPHVHQWNELGKAAVAEAIGGWLESRYGTLISATLQVSTKP
jgi:hypothetical protein